MHSARIWTCVYAMAIGIVCFPISLVYCQRPVVPDTLTLVQHQTSDSGPSSSYLLLHLHRTAGWLQGESVSLTPQVCLRPATAEYRTKQLPHSLERVLRKIDLCAIQQLALDTERLRSPRCSPWTTDRIVWQMQCGTENHVLDLDLSCDAYEEHPEKYPRIAKMLKLVDTLQSAVEGLPNNDECAVPSPSKPLDRSTPLFHDLYGGRYDSLFRDGDKARTILEQAAHPPLPSSVEVFSVAPEMPTSVQLPVYPPIAKAARVEGIVTASFEVTTDGSVQRVSVAEGPVMLQRSVVEAIQKWRFPATANPPSGQASIRFQMNCPVGSQ
jgi:TonB family protein